MMCYQPSSRQERRKLYVQVTKNLDISVQVKRTDYDEYRAKQPIGTQIHVDAKRCLWHYFDEQQLQRHLKLKEFAAYQNKIAMTRFHQRYLELFLIDIMNNMGNRNYFQGLSQIAASFYFAFLREEYLSEDNPTVQEYYQTQFNPELNDFVSISGGIEKVMYNYTTSLTMAITICKSSIEPLFQNYVMLTQCIQCSIEPYLRLFDSRLYQLITQHQELVEIAPNLLMGSLLSALQYNSNTITASQRFLDAMVQGNCYFLLFLTCANFSLAFRFRNPGYFRDDQLACLPTTDDAGKYQIPINDDQDIVYRVMSSLDHAEKIIKDYEEHIIELAVVGYCMVLYSQQRQGKLYSFINENFGFQKKNFLQPKKNKFSTLFNLQEGDLYEAFVYVEPGPYKSKMIDQILHSIKYNIDNQESISTIKVASQVQLVKQLIAHSIKDTNRRIRNTFTNITSRIRRYQQDKRRDQHGSNQVPQLRSSEPQKAVEALQEPKVLSDSGGAE